MQQFAFLYVIKSPILEFVAYLAPFYRATTRYRTQIRN